MAELDLDDEISLFEIGTRLGLPPLESTPLANGLSAVYQNISSSIEVLKRTDDPAEIVPELLMNVGLQVVQQLVGNSNMIAQTVARRCSRPRCGRSMSWRRSNK